MLLKWQEKFQQAVFIHTLALDRKPDSSGIFIMLNNPGTNGLLDTPAPAC
jgi:hypothetical protein